MEVCESHKPPVWRLKFPLHTKYGQDPINLAFGFYGNSKEDIYERFIKLLKVHQFCNVQRNLLSWNTQNIKAMYTLTV